VQRRRTTRFFPALPQSFFPDIDAATALETHSVKHRAMRKLFRNFFLGFGGLIAVIAVMGLIVGPTWEQYERHQAALEFPAPGRLLNIGGRRIQIDCRGTGSLTVVFESGLGIHGAVSWVKVHDPVAKFTRACAYSRAGILWSDDKDGSHDGVGVANGNLFLRHQLSIACDILRAPIPGQKLVDALGRDLAIARAHRRARPADHPKWSRSPATRSAPIRSL
jgi:hypothetical protein